MATANATMTEQSFSIYPADRYEAVDDLGLVTCYFNPSGYATKLKNYQIFRDRIESSGLRLWTIECAFGSEPFTLPKHEQVLQIRSQSILWQKERLLNLGIQQLPQAIQKVVWLDCDILFSNPRWAIETSRLLDDYAVVQPFVRVFRLPQGAHFYQGEAESWRSFAYVYGANAGLVHRGNFHQHGHTGLVWAGRREWLTQYGLYDALVSGSADHMMAHALCGDFTSACMTRIMGEDTPLRSHFLQWGKALYGAIGHSIAAVPGTVLHLWHGDTENRRYVTRHDELMRCGFDPAVDLRLGPTGTWEWNSEKPVLHQWAIDYFDHRQEDGGATYRAAQKVT
jgi:hypothetical protein